MDATIASLVGTAVAIVLSPIAIAAVISMLQSPGGRGKGFAFLAGWASGLTVVGLLTLLLSDLAGTSETQQPLWARVVRVTVAVGLLILAWHAFARRPRSAEEAKTPGWIAAVDSLTPVRIFGLGALLGGVKPKNLLLTISAVVTLEVAGLPRGPSAALFAVFVALSSAGIALPVLLAVLGGERARSLLGRWRGWLIRYNKVLVSVVLALLAAKVLIEGLSGLS